MALQVSLRSFNKVHNAVLCQCSQFSTTANLCKSVKLKTLDMKVPENRRWSYWYDKYGKVKRIDPDIIGKGHHVVPFDLEKADLVSPKELHPSNWGGSMEAMQRVSRDPSK